MSLPNQTLTFYRLPDVTVAAATIVGLLDAIYSALGSATDYRGTSIPATHVWTWARHQNAGSTDAVYPTAVPTGPGVTPRVLFCGASAGAPTMASPDTFVASNVMVGVNKNSGSYNSTGQGWDQALPFTSGQFSGLARVSGTTANAVTTVVRAYVSQESVFIDIIQAAASHWWVLAGAILEPWTDDSAGGSLVSETDNRLYGMMTSGGAAVAAADFLSAIAGAQTFFQHGGSAGNSHAYVLVPNTTGVYAIDPTTAWFATPSGQHVDLAGKFVAQAVDMVRDGAGAAMGVVRGVHRYGLGQGGKTLRNGATDLLHIVGVSTSGTDDAIALRAAA